MVLSIAVLSGMTLEYDVPNTENEVMLVVDASFSSEKTESEKDDFIRSVIDNSDSMFKLGIVTFGYDQVYAAELTNNTGSIYAKYAQAPVPNTTATDIASALNFAAEKFESPESARIVLISDALETDNNAGTMIKSISAKGIKVDTVYFSENISDSEEVQIVGVTLPDEKIRTGERFDITLTIQSSYIGTANVTPYDNDNRGEAIEVPLKSGIQKITIPFEFVFEGLHELKFEIESGDDGLLLNNEYHSYIYIEVFKDILIINHDDSETDAFSSLLKDVNHNGNEEYKIDVIDIDDEEKMPKTVDQLRAYDEVVLVNIANKDMPAGFDLILQSYVRDIGGGLFTVCGNDKSSTDGNWTANAYTREDMYNTVYQDMLPVEVINYTPPVAVMIIIDRSGSMYDPNSNTPEEESKLGAAKLGAEACLDALTERDYVGIMSLGDDYNEQIELTPRPQRDKILSAINSIEGGGGTIFSSALERAGKALSALSSVERRHIIIVTDGEPAADDEQRYRFWLEENAKLGITTSIVGIQCSASAKSKMINSLVDYAQCPAENFHDAKDIEQVPTIMRSDLEAPEIKDVNFVTFTPTVEIKNSITTGITKDNMPSLDGFYGVKAKKDAEVILMGEYTPIYTQWQYGKGTVGTFACDLNGTWSEQFISTETKGPTILNNIVRALFPTENIKPKDVQATIKGDNYATQLGVFTDLAEGEFIKVTVTSPNPDDEVQTIIAGIGDNYSRLNFSTVSPGVHKVVVQKMTKDDLGNESEIASTTIYKALGYSKEYNAFTDAEAAEALMEKLSVASGGEVITEPWQVFENAIKYIHKVIDPKILFMIIALVLFLLDIAVRKFKWKWPHEIIRDKKARAEIAGR